MRKKGCEGGRGDDFTAQVNWSSRAPAIINTIPANFFWQYDPFR